MANNITTIDQVKKALSINSFREVSKAKICEFVSLIPNMDREVALAAINQFPSYSEMASSIVTELRTICDTQLTKNDASQQEVLKAYRKIIDDLGEVLKKESLSAEERDSISRRMIEVADKMSAKDTENKAYIKQSQSGTFGVIKVIACCGIVVLGGKFLNDTFHFFDS